MRLAGCRNKTEDLHALPSCGQAAQSSHGRRRNLRYFTPVGTSGRAAGAVRAAGLRHEAVDYAVEHDAVTETLTDKFLDACDMPGRRQVG
jgi:hypothetical protein